MKNRILRFLVVGGVWLTMWSTPVPRSFAQGPSPVPVPTAGSPQSAGDSVGFSRWGYTDRILRGPFDATTYEFSLPATWELVQGASVQLDLTTFSAGLAAPAGVSARWLDGSLEVSLNGVWLTTVLLDWDGSRLITVPIPVEALVPTRSDGRHELDLFLDSGLNCEDGRQASVVVHPSSVLVLPHGIARPVTDLSLLPRPIYQASFMTDTATIVVPDQPTAAEMEAVLTVAAGFGRMTEGELVSSLVPAGQLSDDARKTSHLIFVGKPAAFPMLTDVRLPVPSSGSGFEAAGAAPDDGIVQMGVSPWDTSKVVLVVSGNTDAAVVKAGRAISARSIRTSGSPDLALVVEVQSHLEAVPALPDRTLADLGYAVTTQRRMGLNRSDFLFFVPPEQAVGPDAYFDLIFSHSALLDYDRSGLTVSLNDVPIGSAHFSDESAQPASARFAVVPAAIRPGMNRLVVQSDLWPRASCVDPRQESLWLTVQVESLLHLPLVPAPAQALQVLDLGEFPAPFTLHSTLDSTAFIVPPDDPVAWAVAAQIAYYLGDQTDGAMAEVVAAYADAIPDDIRSQRDLLVVGRPSRLALVAELGDALPAPFEPGSDLATERNMPVIYRLPAGAHIGYLELLPAPWNANRAILAVLGSTDQGVQWAGAALTVSRLRNRLSGNFAAINGGQVVVGDTRLSASPTGLAATVASGSTGELASATPPPVVDRPAWVLPLLALTIVTLVVIIVIVVAAWLRQRRSAG